MRHYPSKILLFGEYVLLLGQPALAMPVQAFSGRWAQCKPGESAPEAGTLLAFAESAALSSVGQLDTGRFARDVSDGLYFQSDIPVGYGLGSSGALCAGVYDRYALQKTNDPGALKAIFAAMESYFHGQSSGIDPLTSYLNQALWITNGRDVRIFHPPVWQATAPLVFLLDSTLSRQTSPLVQWFMEQTQQPVFKRRLEQELFPAHGAMLDAWESGDDRLFWDALRQVSAFQLAYMLPMIPEHIHSLWETCLASDDLALKICGAGGGGFFLGFAKNKSVIDRYIKTLALVFPFDQHAVVEK